MTQDTMTQDTMEIGYAKGQAHKGRSLFRERLSENPLEVLNLIHSRGFQTAWKILTDLPQHGNNNPNWQDCYIFMESCFKNKLHYHYNCPDLPIFHGLPVPNDLPGLAKWLHVWSICCLYRDCLKENRSAKRDGLVLSRYLVMADKKLSEVEAL